MIKSFCVTFAISLLTLATVWAQEVKPDSVLARKDSIIAPRPRSSTMAIATFKRPSIYIKVVYGQPYKKGREIFGAMEPYGQVWRTGANEATEITTTKDIKIGEQLLKAGTYTIFSIPEKDRWTVIFNSELGQWGAFKYDADKNVLSLDVPVVQIPEMYEAFTIKFDETSDGVAMLIMWDHIKVAVPLTLGK